ncbi:MAG: M28 family peptidase [Cyanobacteria bacterium J06627_28]
MKIGSDITPVTTAAIKQRLIEHLQALSTPRDPYLGAGSHQLAQQYIRIEFAKYGTVDAQSFLVNGKEHFNWQLTHPGQQPQLAPILVGAHYDTVPGSPGADDNASGVAVLLTLAALAQSLKPKRPIHFVAFDLEEYGLTGSMTCANSWRSQNKPLHLMLSLEMLGYFSNEADSQRYPLPALASIYPNRGNFIALVGNEKTVFKMMRLKRILKKAGAPCQWLPMINKGRQLPDVRRSDHAPFWDADYPAVMVTDTANLRNPHYHTPSDRIETLDIDMMANITLGLAQSLCRL